MERRKNEIQLLIFHFFEEKQLFLFLDVLRFYYWALVQEIKTNKQAGDWSSASSQLYVRSVEI